jgi:ribosomal RNA-processing protein 7
VDDFYRFQKREKSRDELLLLREQFELDKQKVAKLKAARKFKPC